MPDRRSSRRSRPAALPRRAAVALATLGALLAAGLPATASATTGEEAAAFLSGQRVANGFPPVAYSASRTDGCAKHDHYMALNGGLVHGEQADKPGYTTEGATTGGAEVLSRGGGPWDGAWSNPWADAPIHLLLMFAPSYATAGWADSEGFQCMRIGESQAAPNPVYSLPGNGATGVPTTIDASGEGPYSPGDVVGVDDTRTGFNVFIYRPSVPQIEIASATLVPAGGAPVAVKTIDDRTTVPGGGPWIWPAAVVVPVAPLAPGTRYALDVAFTDGVTHHADFTTAGTAPGAGGGGTGGGAGGGGTGGGGGATRTGTFAFKVAKPKRRGTKLRLALTASGAALGRPATVRRERRVRTCRKKKCTLGWKASGVARRVTLKKTQTLAVPRPARGVTMRLTVTVDAATVGGVSYGARTSQRTYRR